MYLNENELAVLKACADNAQDAAGGDFGFGDEISGYLDNLSDRQVAGYLSDLQTKGLISIDGYKTNESSGTQITLTKESLEVLIANNVADVEYAKMFDCWYR